MKMTALKNRNIWQMNTFSVERIEIERPRPVAYKWTPKPKRNAIPACAPKVAEENPYVTAEKTELEYAKRLVQLREYLEYSPVDSHALPEMVTALEALDWVTAEVNRLQAENKRLRDEYEIGTGQSRRLNRLDTKYGVLFI